MKNSLIGRVLRGIWNAITRIRLALSNLLFLLFLFLLYLLYVGGAPEPLPDRAALLLDPVGAVVDQRSQADPLAVLGSSSPSEQEVLLRDIIDAIDYASEDPAINSLVMELDGLTYVGLSRTQEIALALERFKETGKSVIATGDFYTQDQYQLASYADTIIMHPLGAVALEGFSSYRKYFREALEKISVNMHVFRAGEYKSAAEHFLRDDMSPGEREITERWLNLLWQQYSSGVEGRRDLAAGSIDRLVNQYAELMTQAGGDAARMARDAGLVDEIMYRREANDYLATAVGARDEDGLYEAVPFEYYLFRQNPLKLGSPSDGERIAVITAEGTMLPGEQAPGAIGGDTLAHLIRTTAAEEDVAAIVLRINSGGGSVFAAEVIRQQVLNARARGIPVVVSMGGMAASGGYYIAAEADEIWATPATITGSIGVYAAFPTVENLLSRLGIHTDGVGTTELAGSLRVDRPLNPQVSSAITSSVGHTYRSFLQIVADGRDMTVAEVDALAQGRIWGAEDALERGLVDALGGLDEAIEAAAARAGVEDYSVDFVQPYRSPAELFMQQLADRMGGGVSQGLLRAVDSRAGAGLAALLKPFSDVATEMGELQDPGHLYMRCVTCGSGF